MILSEDELVRYKASLATLESPATLENIQDKLFCQDVFTALPNLPDHSVDLMFADPPYNLTKSFNDRKFKKVSTDDYAEWLDSWLSLTVRLLKPTASVYICGDWRSSAAIQHVGEKYFISQNRITWEREKGRGAKSNWKNCSEDIWFFTVSEDYYFNVDAVMMKRQVIAPYTDPEWRSEGLERDGKWSVPSHSSFKSLDRSDRSLLVNAGKHRSSDAKTREIAGENHSRQFSRGRSRIRSIQRLRDDDCRGQKAWTTLSRC